MKKRFLKNLPLLLLIGVLLYFLIKSIYIAIKVKLGVPPDEIYHFNFVNEFSSDILVPDNNANTYRFGPINDKPYLYYILLGKLLHLNIFNIESFVFLRFINILFSIGTLIYTYKLAGLFLKNKYFQVFCAFIASNILMFTFLSSSINYDNLLNLLSTISFFYFFRYLKNQKLRHLLLFVIVAGLASLTKFTFLPLAFILVLILLFDLLISNPKKIFIKHINEIKDNKAIYLGLFGGLMIIITLMGELYLMNILNYKDLLPSCTQILTHEQCMENPIYVRSTSTYTSPIHPLNPIEYYQEWILRISASSFGILAHKNMLKSDHELFPYLLIMVTAFLLYVRNLKFKKFNRLILYSLVTCFSFSLILAFYQNYQTYLNTGNIGLALQGRYMFPVLSLLTISAIYPFFSFIKQTKVKLTLLSTIAIIFINGDILYFLRNITEDWFR